MAWQFFHEIGRKIIHLTILIVLFVYYLIEKTYDKQIALLFVVALLVLFLFVEYLRLDLNWQIPFFNQFIREKEKDRVFGVIYFLSGTVISLAVFDFRIAIAVLLMTTFGDMSAALIGKKFGRNRIFRNKTFEGSLAELAVNIAVGILVLGSYYSLAIPLFMALAATIIETFVNQLDDNLMIPLIAGFIGQVLSFFF